MAGSAHLLVEVGYQPQALCLPHLKDCLSLRFFSGNLLHQQGYQHYLIPAMLLERFALAAELGEAVLSLAQSAVHLVEVHPVQPLMLAGLH